MFRTVWNMITALCVLYDLIVIPLYAFDLPNSAPLIVFGWIIMLFWNLDLVVSFLTGFYDEGALILSPARIAVHYAAWLTFGFPPLNFRPEGPDGRSSQGKNLASF